VIINGFKRDLDLSWLTDRQYIEEQLIRYFTPLEDYEDRGRKHFTGRFFEWHVARSDKLRFTESDLLAVQRLSITVPPKAAFDLLENRNSYFAELIAACWQQIGAAPDIRSLPDRDLAEGALFQLYWELRKFHNRRGHGGLQADGYQVSGAHPDQGQSSERTPRCGWQVVESGEAAHLLTRHCRDTGSSCASGTTRRATSTT
jgi:hypothetical protein